MVVLLQDLEELHRLQAEVERDPLSVLDALRSGVSFSRASGRQKVNDILVVINAVMGQDLFTLPIYH